jgi:D-glycero-alpha-D-manno-heptose-7-phosphate kinase
LNALYALRGERVSAGTLAEQAAHIEIDVLRRPIGKQDHYAAAYGGMHLFRFERNGAVSVEAPQFPPGTPAELFRHLMMFWTGIRRDAAAVLAEQRRNTPVRFESLTSMRDASFHLKDILQNGFSPSDFGAVLNEGWRHKRELAGSISSPQIDMWYQRAIEAGAFGGKICGAGGGGFLLFVVPQEKQEAIREALSDLRELRVGYETRGSRVIHPAGW